MPPPATPSPAALAARLPLLAAGVAAVLVAACGGGDSDRSTQLFVQQLSQGRPTLRALSVAPGVDAEALLDWAEYRYPQLFGKGPATQSVVYQGVSYAVRSYPGATYLGVSRQGEVFGLGAFTGGQLQSFGAVATYAAQVQADRCRVYAERCAAASETDQRLRALIARLGLTGDPTVGRTLPHVDDALPQLGKLLFFSKSLSVNRDTACASCHHPVLGGGDGLGLSVGAGAQDPDLVGPGRRRADGQLLVARNANTFFNIALYDRFLFADGRIESLAPSAVPGGVGQPIATPDSVQRGADPLAGPSLPAAQARFPITGAAEMRGDADPGMGDAELRVHLASRLAGEAAARLDGAGWLPRFRVAFDRPQGTAAELITFDNVMLAIAEYQRSAVFVKSPWARYVLGENAALDEDTKLGALAFLRTVPEGGVGCVQCHKGDFFTDEGLRAVGFPQAGPGFAPDRSDIGRGRITGADADRLLFRTPSLLNVAMTGPWGHAGMYSSLARTFRHYGLPDDTVADLMSGSGWCRIPGYAESTGCAAANASVRALSVQALGRMKAVRRDDPANGMPDITSTASDIVASQVVAFLQALTDPCLNSRACLAPWIPRPDEAPDAHQLNAHDRNGAPL